MAIVPDLAGYGSFRQDGRGTDVRLSSPNRKSAGSPYGVLTPEYSGEMVLDTANQQLFIGGAPTANTNWTPVFYGV